MRIDNLILSSLLMVAKYHLSKKVLVVDDDISIRETLSSFLLYQGFSVESAENGYAALEMLHQSSFDLLIVDINMPKMNGLELLSCLKEKKITTPSIIITGLISEGIRKEARKLKVLKVIEKPFSMHDILCNIQQGLKQIEPLNQR